MSEKLTDELEEQQYKRLYWESDVPLRDIKAPLMRRLIYAALILFVLLCVLSVTIKLPDQVELPFVLRTDIKEKFEDIAGGATFSNLSKNNTVNYAFIKCPPAFAVKLHQSRACHLKLYSYPFYEYGSVTGLVRGISVSPDEKGEYDVYVNITDAGALKGKLQPGLKGTAVVVIEEKTLAQYFFRNISKHYH